MVGPWLCQAVVNRVRINKVADKDTMLATYKLEIAQLREELDAMHRQPARPASVHIDHDEETEQVSNH